MSSEPIRLTQYSHGAGCGCKIAPSVLTKILDKVPSQVRDPGLLVGYDSRDDAAVYQIDENGEVIKHSVPVSWVTIKQLLGHVRDYADSLMKQRLGSTIPDGGPNA